LRRASVDELQAAPGVGPIMAEQIRAFFDNERNRQLLDELLDGRVVLVEPKAIRTQAPLDGLKIVLTGTLARWPRREAKQLIESLGGRVTSSVSKATDFVLVGEDPGSKYDDARALGVKTVDEREFVGLLRSKGVEV
jgi:DNA ligase (NAD+)